MNEENIEQRAEEDSYQQTLRKHRAADDSKKIGLEARVAGELISLIENGHKTAAFILAFLLAVISDFADFLGVPAIPLIGDILDLITAGVLTIFFWNIGGFVKIKVRLFVWGASLFELLPFVINDIIPTYVLGVMLSWRIVTKEARKAEELMEEIEEKGGEKVYEELAYDE